jgi:tetratricopeptide (TPR) repeat protein
VSEKLGDAAGERTQLEWLNRHQVGLEAHLSRDVLPQPRLKKNFDERAFRLLSLAVHNALEERLASLPSDQHAAVHKSRGKNLVSEGRLAEAERELAEAASLAPGDGEAHLSLAEILAAEDKPQEAVVEFQAALKLQDSFAGHLGLARVYLSLNRREQARQEAEAALKLNGGNKEAQELVGHILAGTPPN